MKVAIVINTSWNIYNYRRGLITALLERGVEVVAIAPSDNFSLLLKSIGCSFVSVKMDNKGINPFQDLLLVFRLWTIYRKTKPDYILHYTIKPNVYGTWAASLLGIPCISNVSGLGTAFIRKGFLLRIVRELYRFSFKLPQKVFFQNGDDLELFLSNHLVNRNRADLLPGSGIDTREYSLVPYSKRSPFVFLLIGRLLTDKGIKEYAEASKILKQKGYTFISQLVGFYDRTSKYNISEEDLSNWVNQGYLDFLGASEKIADEITKASCVVLPSYREGTPRSLLEAMALGRPIIATKVPGCKEVIVDGENGFFCEPYDSVSLSNAMEKMMTLSEENLSDMGIKGRKLLEERFDEHIVIDKYFKEIFS